METYWCSDLLERTDTLHEILCWNIWSHW